MLVDFLRASAMVISLSMCIFLFFYVYIEGLKMSNTEGKVKAGTFLFSLMMAFVFGFFASSFY